MLRHFTQMFSFLSCVCSGMRVGRLAEDGDRPGSAGPGAHPEQTASAPQAPLEGLAYPQHRPKSPSNLHHGLATLAHVAFNRNPIHYSNPSPGQASSPSGQPSSQAQAHQGHGRQRSPPSHAAYTPVQLPRADIKPYHESYFTETKPPQTTAAAKVRAACVRV